MSLPISHTPEAQRPDAEPEPEPEEQEGEPDFTHPLVTLAFAIDLVCATAHEIADKIIAAKLAVAAKTRVDADRIGAAYAKLLVTVREAAPGKQLEEFDDERQEKEKQEA